MDIKEIVERAFLKHEIKMALKAINEKWITIHPHGDDSDDYRRLKIEDGETVKEAIERQYAKEENKEENIEKAKDINEAIAISEKFVKKGGYKLKNISLKKANKLNSIMQDMKNKYYFDKIDAITNTRRTSIHAQANNLVLELANEFQNGDLEYYKKQINRGVTNWKSDKELWLERYKRDLEKNRFVKEAKKNIKILEEDLKYKRGVAYQEDPNKFFDDVITHEFGHIISMQKFYRDREKAGKIKLGFKDTKEQYKVALENTETANLMKDTYYKAQKNGDIYNISKYANKNYHEFFAECFLMYHNKENLPNYIKEMVEKIIVE